VKRVREGKQGLWRVFCVWHNLRGFRVRMMTKLPRVKITNVSLTPANSSLRSIKFQLAEDVKMNIDLLFCGLK
jgi:hypothetical protein